MASSSFSGPARGRLLLATLFVSLVTGVLAAVAAAPAGSAAPAAPDRTYRNPLAPEVPGDGTVDSCADPSVIRGQGEHRRWWYMYCTTDPLNDGDVDAEGDPVFHPIPTMRSRDLVNWTYVGDALPEPPSWAAEGAGLWAPDVAYSTATDRYYLTFVVTDTDDALRADPCPSTGDSAIGVAVSDNPTGPWEVSDQPVVGPRRDPGAPCSFFWTFDPDILGQGQEPVGAESVLYYGSYYGGVHATAVTFRPDGLTATGAATQVAIGNRYEGGHVVERNGWYWFFGSATNCCNGPLTSYGVFAGRSRSPFGPFLDKEGQSLDQGRVGGSPVVLPNGNRWLGVGHNTAFTDAAGQWWTIYHGVDEKDPYFRFGLREAERGNAERQTLRPDRPRAGEKQALAAAAADQPLLTRRPALLDRLTWVDGWPQVRSGRWASSGREIAPVTRERQRSGPAPAPVAPHRLGAELPGYGDDFSDGLDDGWSWVREPDPATYEVAGGSLRWRTQAGDLARDSNTASVLTRRAPTGDFVVQTEVKLGDLPPEGCCQNYVQAGLVNYADDDRYLKLVHVSIWETRQNEWAKEEPPAEPGYPAYGNGVVGPPGDSTLLRVVVDRRAGLDHYTAYTNQDGRGWVRGGVWKHDLGAGERIGLVSMGGEGYTAEFTDVRVWRLRG